MLESTVNEPVVAQEFIVGDRSVSCKVLLNIMMSLEHVIELISAFLYGLVAIFDVGVTRRIELLLYLVEF